MNGLMLKESKTHLTSLFVAKLFHHWIGINKSYYWIKFINL